MHVCVGRGWGLAGPFDAPWMEPEAPRLWIRAWTNGFVVSFASSTRPSNWLSRIPCCNSQRPSSHSLAPTLRLRVTGCPHHASNKASLDGTPPGGASSGLLLNLVSMCAVYAHFSHLSAAGETNAAVLVSACVVASHVALLILQWIW